MVALSVPWLGYAPEPNFARAFLFQAADALDAGNVTAAGVFLREAVRRQCWAECCWFNCLPDGATERTPAKTLLRALDQAGCVDACGRAIVRECIRYGNAAACCRRLHPRLLRNAIIEFHGVIDLTPCNEPANMPGLPKPGNCFVQDDNDFDPANWWKRSAEGGAE